MSKIITMGKIILFIAMDILMYGDGEDYTLTGIEYY